MNQLKFAIAPRPNQCDRDDWKRRWQGREMGAQNLQKPVLLGRVQLARQGQVKAKLVGHIRVSPFFQKRVLTRAQSGFPAALQLGSFRRAAKAIKLGHAFYREMREARSRERFSRARRDNSSSISSIWCSPGRTET